MPPDTCYPNGSLSTTLDTQLGGGRLQILEGLGFEFGEVAQITDDWEMHFDQLLDWLLWLDADDDASNPGHSIGWCV